MPGGGARGIIRRVDVSFATLGAFFLFVFLASMVPGLDTVVVTRNALRRGTGSAVLTAAGCSTGQLLWGGASALGLAAVLAASASAYQLVKLAGAAYLVYLGLRSLISALSRRRPADGSDDGAAGGHPNGQHEEASRRASYADGLLTNLLNPKTALFFSSFIAQLISPGSPGWLPAALIVLWAAASFLWLGTLTLLLRSAGGLLGGPGPRRVLDAVVGVVLVALGARVALDRG